MLQQPDPPAGPWLQRINSAIASQLNGASPPIRVLEAGGGARTRIEIAVEMEFTTIDISPEALDRNDYAAERILGDLEVFDFGDRRYDLVVVWNVLEHLQNPKRTFINLASTLDGGGLLVVRGPIVSSLKGLLTKFTPHAIHVWFYRYILGASNAGKAGFAPFPTHLRFDVDPKRLVSLLKEMQLEIVALERFTIFHVDKLKRKAPPLYQLYAFACRALAIVTLGAAGGPYTDFALVVRKGAPI